uniref:Uncharacterized protein n=1 Tax=Oryza meridionalis TaxID=40149 RepID=A0A0E0DC75_9ORYZ
MLGEALRSRRRNNLHLEVAVSGRIDFKEKTSVNEWHPPSESFWKYMNITALQEQFFKHACLHSSLFFAFAMIWLTSK